MSADAAIQYARDVLANKIDAGQLVHLAAERFLNDLAATEDPTSRWQFRADLAERVMRFCGLLPNIKGLSVGNGDSGYMWRHTIDMRRRS